MSADEFNMGEIQKSKDSEFASNCPKAVVS